MIEQIPLVNLTLKRSLQLRAGGTDLGRVEEYAAHLLSGGVFDDPIDVFKNGDIYYVVDGFHRTNAAARAGLTSIPARIHEGNLQAAIVWNIRYANEAHKAQRLGSKDRIRKIEAVLAIEEYRVLSDRAIEEAFPGMPRATIGKVRRRLERKGVIQKRTTLVGLDGRQQKRRAKMLPELSDDPQPTIAPVVQQEEEEETDPSELRDPLRAPMPGDVFRVGSGVVAIVARNDRRLETIHLHEGGKRSHHTTLIGEQIQEFIRGRADCIQMAVPDGDEWQADPDGYDFTAPLHVPCDRRPPARLVPDGHSPADLELRIAKRKIREYEALLNDIVSMVAPESCAELPVSTILRAWMKKKNA